MPTINIRGHDVDVDIEAELKQYDWGYRAQWSSNKLIAPSPFRYDRTPSFFVNLDGEYAGTWGDSGYYDEEWASGNFVKLLAFMRQESYEETEEYLIDTYGFINAVDRVTGEVRIKAPKIKQRRQYRPLDESLVTPAVSRYLLKRGIPAEIQALYKTGYGKHRGFTAIPWRRADGALANVKYRATRGKTFFYERGGWPIRQSVWGIDVVTKERTRTAVLCEAEIDAMTWSAAGDGELRGLAAGGVNFTEAQADIIRRSPIKRLILGGDNDKAGRKFNEQAARMLKGHVELMTVNYGDKKDANEAGVEALRRADVKSCCLFRL